ncbi:MAG TPA: hypothetical protein VN714_19885 [Trebonia sp.]|nr:hypothetical protein [Trebonia sp.]
MLARRVMFDAPMASRCLTFSSFAASFSSESDSHCFRSPSSYQAARHRPPLVLGRVHGNPEFQPEDVPASPGGGTVSTPATRLAGFGFAATRLRATRRTTGRL